MTKPNVLSLRSLTNWLGKQPARKTFNFFDNENCLLAQFFKAKGLKQVSVGGYEFSYSVKGAKQETKLPFSFREVGHTKPETFGNALKTARKLLAQGEVA